MRRNRELEPTVTEALVGVVEAGHRLVADRVDLALVEARGMIDASVSSAALLLAGALLLVGALIALDAALVDLIGRVAPRSVAFASCAAFDGALGAALVLAGLRKKARS